MAVGALLVEPRHDFIMDYNTLNGVHLLSPKTHVLKTAPVKKLSGIEKFWARNFHKFRERNLESTAERK
jgi:hypothetical protein